MRVALIVFLLVSNAWAHDSPYDYAAAMEVANGLDCKKLAETSDQKDNQKKYVDSFLLQLAEAFTGEKFASQEAAGQYLENNVPETEREMILSMALPKFFSCIGSFVDKAFAPETPEKVDEVGDVLAKVREAAELGELDALIEKQAQFGRRVTQKNK